MIGKPLKVDECRVGMAVRAIDLPYFRLNLSHLLQYSEAEIDGLVSRRTITGIKEEQRLLWVQTEDGQELVCLVHRVARRYAGRIPNYDW